MYCVSGVRVRKSALVIATLLWALSVALHLGVLEIFHAHPGHHYPHPAHHGRENDECGIVPDDGQGRVVLELRRRPWRLPDVPGPAPDAEAAAHANHEYDPRGR